MLFVAIGVLLLVLKLAGWVNFSESTWVAWSIVLSPFALAVVWWAWADSSGYTQKRAMDEMDAKKAERRERSLQALGLGTKQGTGKRRR